MQLIDFTPAAVEAIHRFRISLQVPEEYLVRIGLRQKNAQDKGLIIGFDQPATGDQRIMAEGMELLIQPGQVFFFAGMVIDFSEINNRSGFRLVEKSKLKSTEST